MKFHLLLCAVFISLLLISSVYAQSTTELNPIDAANKIMTHIKLSLDSYVEGRKPIIESRDLFTFSLSDGSNITSGIILNSDNTFSRIIRFKKSLTTGTTNKEESIILDLAPNMENAKLKLFEFFQKSAITSYVGNAPLILNLKNIDNLGAFIGLIYNYIPSSTTGKTETTLPSGTDVTIDPALPILVDNYPQTTLKKITTSVNIGIDSTIPIEINETAIPQEYNLKIDDTSIITKKKIKIKDSKLFVDENEIKISPKTASKKFKKIKKIELTLTDAQKPVYNIEGTKGVKILYFIPSAMPVISTIDATTGVTTEKKPWWSFLAIPSTSDTVIAKLIDVGGIFPNPAGYSEEILKLKDDSGNTYSIKVCSSESDFSWAIKDLCYEFSPLEVQKKTNSLGCYFGKLTQVNCPTIILPAL